MTKCGVCGCDINLTPPKTDCLIYCVDCFKQLPDD